MFRLSRPHKLDALHRVPLLIAALALALLLPACGVLNLRPASQPTETTEQPTPTESSPTLEAPSAAEPAFDEPEVADDGDEIVLVVWMPEALSPEPDSPAEEEWSAQIAAFEEAHPDLRVEVHTKLTTGPGSTLAYLRSAPPVAPSILPDLALLDQESIVQAASEDLVVPMDTLLDPAIVDSLYPVAVELGTVDNTLVGVPYTLQFDHVVYRETLFPDPPNSFNAVLESPVPFVFPAGTPGSVNRTVLAQYLAAGGTLSDADGNPHLDAVALAEVLTFYEAAREAGVVDPALFQISDPDDSWAMYLGRQAGLATVSSTTYLAGRDELRSSALTWIPTPDGEPLALVTGWLWVIATEDPDRQAAAMALFNFLMNPVNQGGYSRAIHWLPSQGGALAVWGDDDDYVPFADRLLGSAVPLPQPGVRTATGTAIQEALEAVLLNGAAPIQTANEAAQQVNPTGTETQ
jgi:ABC-type glycerol-3-phosphate transport system substrate-binding protein